MTDSPTRPAHVPVPREIWVLVVAAFVIALGFGIVAPILPQYAASFDVGVAAASAIVTVFSLARMLFAPASGALIGRFGERRMYLAGLSVVAASSFLCAVAVGYWDLLLWRGLGGIGSVTFTVASMGLIVRLAPPAARGRTSALYGSAFLLGNVIGPVLGTFLAVLGFRVAFAIYGAAVLVAFGVVLAFLREDAVRRAGAQDAEGEQAVAARPTVQLSEVLQLPAYRALLISGFANGWSTFGVRVALVPLMAASIPAIGAAMAGISMTLMAVGNVIAQQFTGRFTDSLGRRPVLMMGLLVTGVVTSVFGWSLTVPVLLGLSVLIGMGASMIQPASQAMLADIIGAERNGGQALSTFSMATDLGSIAGTLLAGIIAQVFGFGWAFTLTGVALLASLVPWVRVGRLNA